MSWLMRKISGSPAKTGADSAPSSASSSAANSPQRPIGASPLHFAPQRPHTESAASFALPSGALGSGSEVSRAMISLYMSVGSQMELKAANCLLLLVKAAQRTYEFKVVTKEKVLIAQPLVPALTFYFRPSNHTLVWNMSIGGTVHVLVACFGDDSEEDSFKEFFNASYVECGGGGGPAFAKMAEGDRRWAIQASEDMEVDDEGRDYDDDGFSPDEDNEHLRTDEYPDTVIRLGGAAAREQEDAQAAAAASSSSARNDNLAVGMSLNRTFVNRGAQVGVFKHDAHGSLQYLNNIPVVRDLQGQAFAPSKMMLHQQDGKMMLLNPEKKDAIYEMDLEYGKVVQEFNAGDVVPAIRTIGSVNKYAERTNEPTLMGVSNNAVFQLDPRQHGKNKLAEHKLYKTTPKFSSVSTTEGGHVAVGADDGQIRLYDSVSKVAKTCLPGLGDPVLGMDVTADGEYLLATTKHYLLVIPTRVAGQEKSGFRQSITAKAGAPIKVTISPEDMAARNIAELSFTPAHFNVGEGQEEYISTSTGPYVITWDFKKIKQGKRFHYKIKRAESDVVADQWLYGHDDKLVVSLPDNIYLQKMQKK